jgi:phosphoglycolate phosphatase
MDLNGTLVDTLADLTDALNATLHAHGRSALDAADVRQWSGEGLRSLLRSAFQATGPHLSDPELNDCVHRFRDVYADHLGRRAQLYPGVDAALQSLTGHGVRMSILTNKPELPSLKLVEQMGIRDHFDYLVAGDGDIPRKPDPTGLDDILQQLGNPPRLHVLLVGSSRIDLETARNAGVAVALVDHEPTTWSVRGMGADYVLGHFGQLTALVLGERPSGVFQV